MQIKAALFDLDGTLLDTLDDIADAMNVSLARMGMPGHPTDAYRYFVGDGLDTLAWRVLPPQRRSPEEVSECLAVMKNEYRQRYNVRTQPYPGIPEMLTTLQAAGVRLAVLSNKSHEMTRHMVLTMLNHWQFDEIVGSMPQVPKKPDPCAAAGIAVRMNVAATDFLYLGDTATDMQTAIGAGMYPVGALWGFRPREELLEHGAQFLAMHPRDVLAIAGVS